MMIAEERDRAKEKEKKKIEIFQFGYSEVYPSFLLSFFSHQLEPFCQHDIVCVNDSIKNLKLDSATKRRE